MAIYGTAVLSFCLIAGILAGKLLGRLVGIDANVGGVGIAMFLLIYVTHILRKHGHLPPPTESGVMFWSSIYIPIVVAMAANQNVYGALHGGPMAITAGVVAVSVGFLLVPLISKIGKEEPPR